jgi:hypothetical protein
VPWPDQPTLDDRQRAGLAHVLRIEALALPDWCRRTIDPQDKADPNRDKLARLFAVSDMRVHLAEQTSARVCLGGKTSDFSGRYPGVIEEIALALAKNQPVYLLGFAGGATAEVISLLRTGKVEPLAKAITDKRAALKAAFNATKTKVRKNAEGEIPGWIPKAVLPWEWSVNDLLTFIYSKRGQFSRAGNGLDPTENEELWSGMSSDGSIDWILRGLTRLQSRKKEAAASRPEKSATGAKEARVLRPKGRRRT